MAAISPRWEGEIIFATQLQVISPSGRASVNPLAESSDEHGINTAQPTPVSAVNGQIGQIEAQILNIVNQDPTLAKMAVGADGSVGFVALPPGTTSTQGNVASGHDIGPPGHGGDVAPGHGDVVALAALEHLWGH
jgi:hypothetical protein